MTKETIYYQISGTGVAISGLHPKHKKTELNLTNAEFALIRDIMKDSRYSQAFNLLCQEIVEEALLSAGGGLAGSIEMDKLWDNQHIRDKYDKAKGVEE